jgi:Protein of unknown function (DUF3795)
MESGTMAHAAATYSVLIAPCGMDCRLCRAYARERKPCPGCRKSDGPKSKACVTCSIKNCGMLAGQGLRFCFGCDEFPCTRLKHLDMRYRSKYGMSMIENLLDIKSAGILEFVKNENEKWRCLQCGGILCVHKPRCPSCGETWRQINEQA